MPVEANLVRVGAETVATLGSEDLTGQIAHRVKASSGDHGLCHAVDMGTFDRVYCQLSDVSNAPLGATRTLNFTGERVLSIDVDIADDGNFYVVVMTLVSGGSRRARLSGWARDSSMLFSEFEIQPALNWFDASVAANSNEPWIGGSRVPRAGLPSAGLRL